MKRLLLEAHIKAYTPDEVIGCIDKLCPEVSGLCYFDKELGCLMSKDVNYIFYFDPMHRVIEVNKVI